MNREALLTAAKYSLFAIALLIVFFFLKNRFSSNSFVPKEYQLTYVPADFTPNIDLDGALEILNNPYRYSKDFDQLIYDFNMSFLMYTAERMNIQEATFEKISVAYQKHHSYLSDLYFDDFVQLQEGRDRNADQWYANELTSAADALNEVASKYTCFLINQVILELIQAPEGKILVNGKKVNTPCGIVTVEALKPLMDKLQEKAEIEDFSSSRKMLREKTERAVSELATVEVTEKKGLSKQLDTKLLGFSVSSTELELSAMSKMKIGFELNNGLLLDINSNNKTLDILLPQPSIIAHEVSPRIDKLDIGWLRELEDSDLNVNMDNLRKAFRESSFTPDVKELAKSKAEEILNNLLSPILLLLPEGYSLNIKYEKESFVGESKSSIDY